MSEEKNTKEFHAGWEYDREKVDEMVLALLHLTTLRDKLPDNSFAYRAWRGYDWDALNRLHSKGMINDPGMNFIQISREI